MMSVVRESLVREFQQAKEDWLCTTCDDLLDDLLDDKPLDEAHLRSLNQAEHNMHSLARHVSEPTMLSLNAACVYLFSVSAPTPGRVTSIRTKKTQYVQYIMK